MQVWWFDLNTKQGLRVDFEWKKKKIIKNLEVNGNWEKLQHDFIKEGLYQTNLISLFDKLIVPEMSNAVDLIYLDRNKALYLL